MMCLPQDLSRCCAIQMGSIIFLLIAWAMVQLVRVCVIYNLFNLIQMLHHVELPLFLQITQNEFLCIMIGSRMPGLWKSYHWGVKFAIIAQSPPVEKPAQADDNPSLN